jgi:hypothetical protein
MTKIRELLVAVAAALLFYMTSSMAEVFPVEQIEKGMLINPEPSLTMYWQGKSPKALLLFIPGGEGKIGLWPGQSDHPYHFYQMLKRLTNPALTSGKFDVVLLDSPRELSPRQRYPAARGTSDHLIRIESAIRHYKEKTGLPIWLMGHSNGGISLTEFVKYLQSEKKVNLISGIVASAIRSESYFNPPIEVPVLFMHHSKDSCASTSPSASEKTFLKVKEFNKSLTEFAYVTTGDAEEKNPCYSGYHMYYGASEEAATIIDVFMSKAYPD